MGSLAKAVASMAFTVKMPSSFSRDRSLALEWAMTTWLLLEFKAALKNELMKNCIAS